MKRIIGTSGSFAYEVADADAPSREEAAVRASFDATFGHYFDERGKLKPEHKPAPAEKPAPLFQQRMDSTSGRLRPFVS